LSSNNCKSRSAKLQGDREFHVHSDYTLSLVINCLYIENKFEKMNDIYISGESDGDGAFNVLEFICRGQMQFETYS